MRGINLSNEKKRDAVVGFAAKGKKSFIKMVLSSGKEKRNIKFIKTVIGIDDLVKKHGDLVSVGKAIMENDDETDMETAGKILGKTNKLYKTSKGEIAYQVNMVQVVHNPDGSEKERRDLNKSQANISSEIPLQWTGRKFKREEAFRKFVFTKNYQIFHTNGLTYDFLYDMAKELYEEDSMMFVGAGKKGNEPIVLNAGGESYRGFLEGRIEGEKYKLILHLTNMELKPLNQSPAQAAPTDGDKEEKPAKKAGGKK
jgi:hypothetical protein